MHNAIEIAMMAVFEEAFYSNFGQTMSEAISRFTHVQHFCYPGVPRLQLKGEAVPTLYPTDFDFHSDEDIIRFHRLNFIDGKELFWSVTEKFTDKSVVLGTIMLCKECNQPAVVHSRGYFCPSCDRQYYARPVGDERLFSAASIQKKIDWFEERLTQVELDRPCEVYTSLNELYCDLFAWVEVLRIALDPKKLCTLITLLLKVNRKIIGMTLDHAKNEDLLHIGDKTLTLFGCLFLNDDCLELKDDERREFLQLTTVWDGYTDCLMERLPHKESVISDIEYLGALNAGW